MNLSYLINYIILGGFISLFLIEVGVAISALALWKTYKNELKHYLTPIWEIDGTFAVFYLVNFEATYPQLLPALGLMYIFPVLFGAAFLIFRNAFIAYSEMTDSISKERSYIIVYAVATLVIAFFAISVLASGVSGAGANLALRTLNVTTMLFNPFSLLLFASAAFIAVFMATVFFNLKPLRKIVWLPLIAAILIILLDLYVYVPYMFSNIFNNLIFLSIVIAALILSLVAYYTYSKYTKALAFLGLFLGVIFFGVLQYPYLFGGTTNITAYLNNSAISQYVLIITIIGGMFVLASLAYFIRINYSKEYEENIKY